MAKLAEVMLKAALLQMAEDIVLEAEQARRRQAAAVQPQHGARHASAAQHSPRGADSQHADSDTASSGDSYSDCESDRETSSSEADNEEEAHHHDDASTSQQQGFTLAPGRRQQVELAGLQLDGLDAVDPQQLAFQVSLSCTRIMLHAPDCTGTAARDMR